MLNIAVCDDDRTILADVSAVIDSEMKTSSMDFEIQTFSDGNDLIKQHSFAPFDVVFLDIMMPKISGYDIAESINSPVSGSIIVFMTSQDQLVYECFDYQPFDFIRKSMSDFFESSIRKTVKKLLQKFRQYSAITLNLGHGDTKDVTIADILFLESRGHYVYYYLKNGSTEYVREKLSDIEVFFTNYDFIRIHKSYIINPNYIISHDKSADEFVISNGVKLKIGRTQKSGALEKYKIYRRRR